MSKRIYISADYSANDGDCDVIDVLHSWGNDNFHKVDYVDTAGVVSGSVSNNSDCRACDLKAEFNRQINASSVVIFVIGDKTKERFAGSSCKRISEGAYCSCTPYKQNVKGASCCRVVNIFEPKQDGDVGNVNSYSYIEHEFMQAEKRGKKIVIVYNSLNKQPGWLPSYMKDYENIAMPFWIWSSSGVKIGNYDSIKEALGYE